MANIPQDVHTYLAWQFESVMAGTFRRDKVDYAHIEFPILGPLPTLKAATSPIEGAALSGPFIYFVLNGSNDVQYVGKSQEKTVVKRWVRPGIGGPSTHYWSHTNKNAGYVRRMAEGIQSGAGPFQLRFIPSSAVPSIYFALFATQHEQPDALVQLEQGFISLLKPAWNGRDKRQHIISNPAFQPTAYGGG